ncbi:hypothetical protein JCM8097_006446 [Rhodosporidiobolus ruineniae]
MSSTAGSTRSVSPTTSTATRQSSSSRSHGPASTSNLESTITRLLVATKQLLEGLAKWSRGEVSEDAISAIYVKLGNDFNVACAAFAREQISMNELLSVPGDLRICLETCLSDTPSQATLERHLPQVRQIIIGLLHGLREKQRLYRDGVAARRARDKAAAAAGGGGAGGGAAPAVVQGQQNGAVPLTPNSAGRSREELRRFVSQQGLEDPTGSASGGMNGGPRPRYSDGSVASSSVGTAVSRRSASDTNGHLAGGNGAPNDPRLSAALSSRMSGGAPQRGGSLREQRVTSGGGSERSGSVRSSRSTMEDIGFMPSSAYSSSSAASSLVNAPAPTSAGMPRSNSSSSLHSTSSASRLRRQSPPPPPRAREDVPRTPTLEGFSQQQQQSSTPSSTPATSSYPFPGPPSIQPPPVPTAPSIPSTIVRPPSTSYPDAHPTPSSSSQHLPAPAPSSIPTSASFEALKSADHLSRRASKRYSAYAIQKMTSPQPGSGAGGAVSPSSPGGSVGGESPRADRSGGRGDVFSSRGDVRRSKSEHGVRSTRSGGGGGAARGVPPVPGIPRSFSREGGFGASVAGTGRSPILEQDEDEEDDEQRAGEEGETTPRKPPAFAPPAAPSSSSSVPRSGSAPTLGATVYVPAGSNQLSPGPAYPAHLAPRAPSPALPPLPSETSSAAGSPTAARSPPPQAISTSISPSPPLAPSFPITIFLRLSHSVRKTLLHSPPSSVEDLRQLFVERFGYHPTGPSEGWPEVYVQDERTGVRYELEDMAEVTEGTVLSLNLDAVEQVKSHIDHGLSTLAQDIKELRATVTAMRRLSIPPPSSSSAPSASLLSPNDAAAPVSPTVGMRASPSQKQFEQAAEKVLRMRRAGSVTSLAVLSPSAEGVEDLTKGEGEKAKEGEKPAPAAAAAPAVSSEPFSPTTSIAPIVSTLQSQHAEVQNLRREIGILRQIYSDFTSQTRTLFASVRVQTSHLHGLAQSKLSTDRAFVEAGTQKLDSDSTDLVVRVDELQDTLEQLRADTLKGVKPRPQQLAETASALRKATEQRAQLVAWLAEVKPSWAQMWSNELAKIIGEQKAVETQETLLGELDEDLKDVAGVLHNIQAVAKQLKPASGPVRAPSQEFGGAADAKEGLSTVLMEVKALQPDPSRRLEAIARAEKERERANANRTDEFADELGEFVGAGKLRKSGGVEETERLRQKRSEAVLRAMFSGGGA